MTVITKEQLQNLTPNTTISGIILVKNYSIALTKNGKEYVMGELMSGVSIPFKAWNNSGAFAKFKNEAYENVPSLITGSVDNYGGTISIIVDTVQAIDGYTADQFFPIKYNIDAYWDALKAQIEKRVSAKGVEICNNVLFNNTELAERFKYEFAAMSHHDNCKGGLLAHTFKVINNMANIVNTYPDLVKRDGVANQDFIDLLYIGCLLHDIGKTVEMQFGVYQPEAIVTHRFLGIEFIIPYKEVIISSYSDTWYYNLISILLQHHGEFEDPCRTVAAYLVHKADVFDSDMTLLAQTMESVNNADGSRIKIGGSYLTI